MIRRAVTVGMSLFAVSSLGAPAATAVPGGGQASLDVAPAKIDASVATVTYDCGNQSPIKIVGQDATVTLNGSCGEVDVAGIANTVNLQTVAIIKATGAGNHITWMRGPGTGIPQISNTGGSNSIVGPGGIQAW